MPLLTRLSIARSTSRKGKKHTLVSILSTYTILAMSLPVPRVPMKWLKLPRNCPSCLVQIIMNWFPSIHQLILSRFVSSQVRPRSSSAATRRTPTQPLLFLLGPRNRRTVAGIEDTRRGKSTEHTVKLGGESRAIIALGNGARACQVRRVSEIFFFDACAVRAELAMIVCIPDREGGTGCSHEAWRAVGACQP